MRQVPIKSDCQKKKKYILKTAENHENYPEA